MQSHAAYAHPRAERGSRDRQTSPCKNALQSIHNAAKTRERILAVARIRFSLHSYEIVGTRDIATDAGVDTALVNRYFGSKEQLFAEVIQGGFDIEEHLPARMEDLGAHLVAQVLANDAVDAETFNALSVLLRAIGNPVIAPMVSLRLHEEFVEALAKRLKSRDTEARAALIASYVIGLATMRHGLSSPALSGAAGRKAGKIAAAAIQACV
ncbi:transcriptional regulator, TetR family [Burkholderia sp. D7]|nr:transcriptional regulator, TetR family [Burkholderia sp. D7]